MNASQSDNQQMIVVAALVERTNLACLAIEDPLHSLTGGTQTSHSVLRIEEVLTLLNTETKLLCILLQTFKRLVLTDILAELVVCIAISTL